MKYDTLSDVGNYAGKITEMINFQLKIPSS